MPGFFDYENETHRKTAIDLMVQTLADQVADYERKAKAKIDAESDGKKAPDVTLKAMASMQGNEDTVANVTMFGDMLSALQDDFTAGVVKGEEHAYANAALIAQAFADHFTELAQLWSPTYKAQTEQFTDGDRVSDDRLAELAKACDASFRALLDNVKQTSDRQQDKSAKDLIERVTGQTVKIREGERGVNFQLAIPRFRRTQSTNANAGSAQDYHVVLYVDGKRPEGATITEQARGMFALTPEDLYKKVEDSAYKLSGGASRSWDFGKDYGISHNDTVYIVRISKDAGKAS